jgi:serine/threonine-protein kinase HipA
VAPHCLLRLHLECKRPLSQHGFLLEKRDWALAPAYDINPVSHGGLTINISETDNSQDLELVLDVAKHFRVKAKRAKKILDEVESAVRQWRGEAKRAGILRTEQYRMAGAFRIADRRG